MKLAQQVLKQLDENSEVKELLGRVRNGDSKAEKELVKTLSKQHKEVIKDFDKGLKAAMKDELARLKKQYGKEFSLTLSPVSKRVLKDVSGNSDSRFGDWYDSLEFRLSITHKA